MVLTSVFLLPCATRRTVVDTVLTVFIPVIVTLLLSPVMVTVVGPAYACLRGVELDLIGVVGAGGVPELQRDLHRAISVGGGGQSRRRCRDGADGIVTAFFGSCSPISHRFVGDLSHVVPPDGATRDDGAGALSVTLTLKATVSDGSPFWRPSISRLPPVTGPVDLLQGVARGSPDSDRCRIDSDGLEVVAPFAVTVQPGPAWSCR